MKTIGVLGLGSIGKRHADNLLAMGHKVVAYEPKFAEYTKAQGDIVLCKTEEAFRDAHKDGLVIATPSNNHAGQLIYSEGPVLVEKPIGVSPGDAEALMGTRLDQQVMVGNNLRFHDCVEQAREWLPTIGTPIWARFTCAQFNDRPDYLRDGVTLNWLSHEVDLARHLLGEAEVVACAGDDQKVVDILLLHSSGARTAVHGDYLSIPHRRYFTIHGTDGYIECDLEKSKIWLTGLDGQTMAYVSNLSMDDTYVAEMYHFVQMIGGEKSSVAASGEDGLAVLRILLKAKEIMA